MAADDPRIQGTEAAGEEAGRLQEVMAGRRAKLEALRAEHVHVELLDPERRLHWIDFRARPATDDAFAREHLEPLTEFVLELTGRRVDQGIRCISQIEARPRVDRHC